jgi:hypothetical protein
MHNFAVGRIPAGEISTFEVIGLRFQISREKATLTSNLISLKVLEALQTYSRLLSSRELVDIES